MTHKTLPYIGRQFLTYLGLAFLPFYLTVFTYSLVTGGRFGWLLAWIAVGAFFVLERTTSVRRGGWRSVCLSALVVPEVLYDLFLHSVYVKAAVDTAIRATETWAYAPLAADAGGRRRRFTDRMAVAIYATIGLVAIVGAAFACMALGIAWTVIAVLVLAGTAQARFAYRGSTHSGSSSGAMRRCAVDPHRQFRALAAGTWNSMPVLTLLTYRHLHYLVPPITASD